MYNNRIKENTILIRIKICGMKTEVSVLSPRVAFLDHQRLLLNVDNSAIKQRIAALAQDKIFKDGNFTFKIFFFTILTSNFL